VRWRNCLVALPQKWWCCRRCKLFTNAHRYIEFAATNEFYLTAKSAGVDYQRILKAMKHHYPRLSAPP
jgi:UDP-N-acetyl-D-mannosaminuronic acid dehydrogenase